MPYNPPNRHVTFARTTPDPPSILRPRPPPSRTHTTHTPTTTESRRDQVRRHNLQNSLSNLRTQLQTHCNLNSPAAIVALTVLSLDAIAALLAFASAQRATTPIADARRDDALLRAIIDPRLPHPHEQLVAPTTTSNHWERAARRAHITRRRRIAEHDLSALVSRALHLPPPGLQDVPPERRDQLVLDALKKRISRHARATAPTHRATAGSAPSSPLGRLRAEPRSPNTDPLPPVVYTLSPGLAAPAPSIRHTPAIDENFPMADLHLPSSSFDASGFKLTHPAITQPAAHPMPAAARPPAPAAPAAFYPAQPGVHTGTAAFGTFVTHAPHAPHVTAYPQTPPQPPLPSPYASFVQPAHAPAYPQTPPQPPAANPFGPAPAPGPGPGPAPTPAHAQTVYAGGTPTQPVLPSPYVSTPLQATASTAAQTVYTSTPTQAVLPSPYVSTPLQAVAGASAQTQMVYTSGTPTQTVQPSPYVSTPLTMAAAAPSQTVPGVQAVQGAQGVLYYPQAGGAAHAHGTGYYGGGR